MDHTIVDWGKIPYVEALEKQKILVEQRKQDLTSDTFVFCEHDPVVTLGRASFREKTIQTTDLECISIERGGKATYHGPGQIVVYPISKLLPKTTSLFPGGIKQLVCTLENSTIELLKHYNVNAHRIDGKIGVWIENERKIASIGIAVSHWISYHGLAFNVNTNKSHWEQINPCGFSSKIITNLVDETAFEVSQQKVKSQFKEILLNSLSTSLNSNCSKAPTECRI